MARRQIMMIFDRETEKPIISHVAFPIDIPQETGGILLDDVFKLILTNIGRGISVVSYPETHHET